MNPTNQIIKAKILDGNEYIPIEARYLSKYSIYIRFLNGKSFPNGFIFKRFEVKFNGSNIKLGPCKLLKETKSNSKQARLVFVKDIYDLDNLFLNKNVIKLQSQFINLSLILRHKDKIKREFKDYTANLTYDLNVYQNLFDQIDEQIYSEKEEVVKILQKSIIESEGRKFMIFLNEKLDELEKLVADYSLDEHERHGFYFRKQLWNMILSSPIMARTNLKPRGYAGDYEMMKMIYDNHYEGNSTFGMIMHKHPMEHPAAQAVRTRRKLIASSFQDIERSDKWDSQKGISLLSVACGPAYELQDIFADRTPREKYKFTLLDQDKSALNAARSTITNLENELSIKLNVKFLNESVRTMLKSKQISDKWGKFNFIYSMGLFDYLTPPAARVVAKKLFQLLLPGGEMIIGNFHVSNPSKHYMEYWLDWVLYYRTEDEFLALLESEKSAECSVFFENTGSQMFLHVKKKY